MLQNQRISREKSEDPEEDRHSKRKTHQIAYDQLKTPDEGIMPESDSLRGFAIENHADLLSGIHSNEQKANMVTQLQQSHGNTYVQRVVERIQTQEGLGQPLEVETRSKMEAAFNQDLRDVRIHSDAAANEITRNLNATATTSGTDIFFGEGRYQPGSESGRTLLSHELTHVLQQKNSRLTESESIGQEGDAFEQEADQISNAVNEGNNFSIETASAVPALQRQVAEAVSGAVSGATEALPEAAEAARTQAFGALQEVMDGLLSERPDFSSIIARIMEIVSTLRGAASSAMGRASGFLGGMMGRAGSAIGGLAGRAGGAIGGMVGRARGFLGGLFG